MYVELNHNIEVAHRLSLLPGKCQQIHGHSMKVHIKLYGHPDKDGIFEGLDFGDLKKRFRTYLDTHFDHKLLLNEEDPWTTIFHLHDPLPNDPIEGRQLPGLVEVAGDPTTENLVKWIGKWALEEFRLPVDVHIDETCTNAVGMSFR